MSGSVETPKEGERVLAASRRPDGTMRKPVRIRAGYTPQDEVAIYQSKAALFKQGMPVVPPGYDPQDAAAKPKTKAAKKNEKRKEKKQQSHQGGSSSEDKAAAQPQEKAQSGDGEPISESDISGVVQQMNSVTVSKPAAATSSSVQEDKADLEKRIRALRKKIRSAESLQMSSSGAATLAPEQMEKLSKLDAWRKELQSLEA